MNALVQALTAQNFKPEEIDKIVAVMNHPAAYQHAMATSNFEAAYLMTLPSKEERVESVQVDLNTWFSSFAKAMPEDATALSECLSKFALYVHNLTEESKTPA